MNSILNTIKPMIGIRPEDESFDLQMVVTINSALSQLNQLGFGPVGGLVVRDSSTSWDELIGDKTNAEFVKTYLYFKTKLAFDPPTNSAAIAAIERQLAEIEWRIVNL